MSTPGGSVARLIGGPAHGRVLTVAEDYHRDIVVPEVDDPGRLLAEYDPLEALYDPLYPLASSATFTQHRYRQERYVVASAHPCIPDVGVAHWRYPWLHSDASLGDPLIASWVLGNPVDRVEWFDWDPTMRQWTSSPDRAGWMCWTTRPRHLIIPRPRRIPPVLGPSAPDYALLEKRRFARTAADRAEILYPGVVGELLSRELRVWAEFGWRLTEGGLIDRLITFLLAPERTVDNRGRDG